MNEDKFILVTGGAQRIGRSISLAVARAGANVVVHYWRSRGEAESVCAEIEALGRKVILVQADLEQPDQISRLIPRILKQGQLFGLVNNAAVFEKLDWKSSSLEAWNRHLMINLTAPFLLSQAFAQALQPGEEGRIINLVDWRALRPGPDHLPYTISKSALAALTRSMAAALAPRITVNGLALGAILPPSDGGGDPNILDKIPSGRWATLEEVDQALIFFLNGPAYITGEILHIDGGRHLL